MGHKVGDKITFRNMKSKRNEVARITSIKKTGGTKFAKGKGKNGSKLSRIIK